MTDVFARKLETLGRTIAVATASDHTSLAGHLRNGRGRRCIAVGSGGSMVAAAFLARCRGTLGLGPTTLATPMELVLGDTEVRGSDVWLFSAGSSNPDIEAAWRHCRSRGVGTVTLVTTRRDGRTAVSVADDPMGDVVVLPVADEKDGFLATHSLMASIAALLFTADLVAHGTRSDGLVDAFAAGTALALVDGSEARASVADFGVDDTVLLLHDPQSATIARLVETSLWETGMAPVQSVDFRNFAHGRHVWLARRPERSFVLAVTSRESRSIWGGISAAFPRDVRTGSLDFGNAGRLRTAISVAAGLAIVDELGRTVGVDPGRPGRGVFAPAVYDHHGLLELVDRLTPAIAHKRAANLLADPIADPGGCLLVAGAERRRRLDAGGFAAIVLDYDGTIVANDRREALPDPAIVSELVRLMDSGVGLGIATGRGGSAGEALRSALPERVHDQVVVGYYNGAHVLPLSVSLADRPPPAEADIADLAAWLADGELVGGRRMRSGPVQIAIDCDATDAGPLLAGLVLHPAIAAGRLKLLRSQHSVDVVSAGVSKLGVVAALRDRAGGKRVEVLAVGDSGSAMGNDFELLSGPMSVSVGQVCGDADGCWTLLGDGVTGPEALRRILHVIVVDSGSARLDLARLERGKDESFVEGGWTGLAYGGGR